MPELIEATRPTVDQSEQLRRFASFIEIEALRKDITKILRDVDWDLERSEAEWTKLLIQVEEIPGAPWSYKLRLRGHLKRHIDLLKRAKVATPQNNGARNLICAVFPLRVDAKKHQVSYHLPGTAELLESKIEYPYRELAELQCYLTNNDEWKSSTVALRDRMAPIVDINVSFEVLKKRSRGLWMSLSDGFIGYSPLLDPLTSSHPDWDMAGGFMSVLSIPIPRDCRILLRDCFEPSESVSKWRLKEKYRRPENVAAVVVVSSPAYDMLAQEAPRTAIDDQRITVELLDLLGKARIPEREMFRDTTRKTKAAKPDRSSPKYNYNSIVSDSDRMYEILQLIDKVTESDCPVLLLGESGTGKELIARAIHENGPRKDHTFAGENCAAFSDSLVESEFFGHVRGAFTGADLNKDGLFKKADKGTLFLDEIGDMSLAMQAKFLRVLQEGEFRQVGGKDIVRVNVRVISATNKKIDELVREGRFREDLLYRINVIAVTLPPLRERRNDIPLLIDHFLKKGLKNDNEKKKELDHETSRLLYQYNWPGNIRELKNVVERLVLVAENNITADLLPDHIRPSSGGNVATHGYPDPRFETLKSFQNKCLRIFVDTIITHCDGSITKAAQAAGVTREYLSRLKTSLEKGKKPE